MPGRKKMSIDERYSLLRIMQGKCAAAKRKERSQLLDHLEYATGLNRKTLIRHMSSEEMVRRLRQKQRSGTCGHQVDDALRVISESPDYICAERPTPHLVPMAGHLVAHGELQRSDQLRAQLARTSIASMLRRLRKSERL